MKHRRSDDELPRSPLDFAHPLEVRGPGMEGAAILEEVAPAVALVLLKTLRLVNAWSRGPDAVGDLVRCKQMSTWEEDVLLCGVDEQLRPPVAVIASALKKPGRADANALARCCFAITEWALEQGAESTALHFAEAAALAWPENARYAWVTGRMLRNAGRFSDAESWLKRAARVAVWRDDWEAQDLALNSLGNLYVQIGRFGDAQRCLDHAFNAALKYKLRDRESAVTHDLLMLHAFTGQWQRAEEMALRSFDLHPPDHPNVLKLAHDTAQLWIETGRAELSLTILYTLLPCFQAPEERLRVLASTIYAAGFVDDRTAYDAALPEARQIMTDLGDSPGTLSWVLLDIGIGAACMGDWEYAAETLTFTLASTQDAGIEGADAKAEAALDSVFRRTRIQAPRRIGRTRASQHIADSLLAAVRSAVPTGPAANAGSIV
jgi:tetratricopeptide (TPR) repeat protein